MVLKTVEGIQKRKKLIATQGGKKMRVKRANGNETHLSGDTMNTANL